MYLGLGLMRRRGKGGGTFVPGTVPKVLGSSIQNVAADGILIKWDRPLIISSSLKEAITVTVNGAVIPAKSVDQNPTDPTMIGIVMNVPFKLGDVVTWAYNDQHATEFLKGAETGGVKADNQTYAVNNNISAPPATRAFSSGFSGGLS